MPAPALQTENYGCVRSGLDAPVRFNVGGISGVWDRFMSTGYVSGLSVRVAKVSVVEVVAGDTGQAVVACADKLEDSVADTTGLDVGLNALDGVES